MSIAKQIDIETDRRHSIRKEVDKILNIRDEKERLRKAFQLWLKVNPRIEVSYSDGSRAWVTARVAYKQTLEKIRYIRENQETTTGKRKNNGTRSVGGKSANWRSLMEFPPGSTEFMQMFAVEAFKASGEEQKKATYHLAKVFPDLVIPEVL